MLRIIYNLFKSRFHELLVEDFYSFIPSDIREPSLEFLAGGKDKLQKMWQIQAYNMQRRSILDSKHAETYQGILIILRAQLLVLEKGGKMKYEKPEETPKTVDPVSQVEDFIKVGKERNIKK